LLLEISNVTKTFPGPNARPVLCGVSLTLAAGDTLALTGESGSGKSTLLHLAGALDNFDSGEITVAGTALSTLGDTGRAALRRSIVALVFQQFNLIPSLDVAQNLAFHARLGGALDPDWLALLTDRLGLSELTERYPEQLSGGQQQRVAIGRAMALRPKLLLADEPTGNLDQAAGDRVLELMLQLVDEAGAALLLVTHSDRIATRLGHRVHLDAGKIVGQMDGQIEGQKNGQPT